MTLERFCPRNLDTAAVPLVRVPLLNVFALERALKGSAKLDREPWVSVKPSRRSQIDEQRARKNTRVNRLSLASLAQSGCVPSSASWPARQMKRLVSCLRGGTVVCHTQRPVQMVAKATNAQRRPEKRTANWFSTSWRYTRVWKIRFGFITRFHAYTIPSCEQHNTKRPRNGTRTRMDS